MLKQINIENQTINLLSEEELSKKIEVVGKNCNFILGGNWKQTVNFQRTIKSFSLRTIYL